MATVTNKRKVLSIKGKVKVIRKQKMGGGRRYVLEIWSCKFYNPNNLEKQNRNYYCI